MTNFIIIDPTTKSIHNFEANDLHDALLAAGLGRHEVAPGYLSSNVGIVCYEFGLLNPKYDKYFCCYKRLYNGPCVLYGISAIDGNIASLPTSFPNIIKMRQSFAWLDGKDAVEKAIAEGKVIRPQVAVNGEVVWQWNKS